MDLPRCRLLLISDSNCALTPGWPTVLALTDVELLPARIVRRSALPKYLSFEAHSLQGRLDPLPLFLVQFPAYASTRPLLDELQGWIQCPWLTATPVGIPPTGTDGLAGPQHL